MKSANSRAPRSAPIGILVVALAAYGCRGEEPPQRTPAAAGAAATVAEAAKPDAASGALLAQLEKTPARVVRLIAVVKPGTAAKAQLSAALKAANAQALQDLAPQPMVVIEVNAAQLRAVLATGQVVRVQADSAAPTN